MEDKALHELINWHQSESTKWLMEFNNANFECFETFPDFTVMDKVPIDIYKEYCQNMCEWHTSQKFALHALIEKNDKN